jgi:hypothetical protein
MSESRVPTGVARLVGWANPVGIVGTLPMRDWLLILAPFAIVAYFLLYPSDFNALIAWLIR